MTSKTKNEYCQTGANPYPFYSPRFWAGMRFRDYTGMLAKHRFRIHPSKYAMTLLVGGCALTSSGLAVAQHLLMNRKIQATKLDKPPVFVIGHWRSGTTLLHEMLCLDDQFAWPSTFECFVPTHHLFSGPVLHPLTKLLMPKTRPMDSMPAGPAYPQEDEFALIGMGAPTPYYQIAFCNEEPQFVEMLNLQRAANADVASLRKALEWFYKSLTYKKKKQLALKSPTHTGRIGYLSKWFPGAKFVHITRHPYKIFPSTIHLWRSLADVQGYQLPKDDSQLVEYVNKCYTEIYEGYFDQVKQIPEKDIVQVKFEDLVNDPVSEIESVYSGLELDGFDTAKPKLQEFWSKRQSHRTNKTQLTDETREQIDRVWSDYIQQFGYSESMIAKASVSAAGISAAG